MTDPAAPQPPWTQDLLGGLRHVIGDTIAGRYRLERPVGQGGNAEVWSAEDQHTQTRVAIKLLLAEGAMREGLEATISRFTFEARVSAILSQKSEHIIRVHDTGTGPCGPFLVMDLVEGLALDELIVRDGPQSPARTLEVLSGVAKGLAAAHSLGIVHRDLKPPNIMLGQIASDSPRVGVIKLTDFGVAKSFGALLQIESPKPTSGGLIVGTPEYMSPEQVEGQPVSAAVDLWALAVVAYEMLTAKVPFCGETAVTTMLAIFRGRYLPASAHRPDLPLGVDAWFRRAFDPDRTRRFESLDPMIGALRTSLGL